MFDTIGRFLNQVVDLVGYALARSGLVSWDEVQSLVPVSRYEKMRAIELAFADPDVGESFERMYIVFRTDGTPRLVAATRPALFPGEWVRVANIFTVEEDRREPELPDEISTTELASDLEAAVEMGSTVDVEEIHSEDLPTIPQFTLYSNRTPAVMGFGFFYDGKNADGDRIYRFACPTAKDANGVEADSYLFEVEGRGGDPYWSQGTAPQASEESPRWVRFAIPTTVARVEIMATPLRYDGQSPAIRGRSFSYQMDLRH